MRLPHRHTGGKQCRVSTKHHLEQRTYHWHEGEEEREGRMLDCDNKSYTFEYISSLLVTGNLVT